MKTSAQPSPLSAQIASDLTIWIVSLASGLLMFATAVAIQWLVYDDWLHDRGPLRLIGSLLAGGIVFAVAFHWQVAARRRKLEMLERFERIKWMNDRIRNSLQAIECVTYVAGSEATESVRIAVDAIEAVLHEVLSEADSPRSEVSLEAAAPGPAAEV